MLEPAVAHGPEEGYNCEHSANERARHVLTAVEIYCGASADVLDEIYHLASQLRPILSYRQLCAQTPASRTAAAMKSIFRRAEMDKVGAGGQCYAHRLIEERQTGTLERHLQLLIGAHVLAQRTFEVSRSPWDPV